MTEAQKYAIPIAHPELRSMLPSMSRSSFSGYLEKAFEAGAAWQRERDAQLAREPYSDEVQALAGMEPFEVGEQIAKAIESFDGVEKKT